MISLLTLVDLVPDSLIVVVGATGNHGSSLVRRLSRDPEVDAIVGVARRRPSIDLPKV